MHHKSREDEICEYCELLDSAHRHSRIQIACLKLQLADAHSRIRMLHKLLTHYNPHWDECDLPDAERS